MGREFQPLGLHNNVGEIERARIVQPESLEGLMAVALTDPVAWEEVESVLVGNKALLKQQGDDFKDLGSVMRRILEIHIGRGLQRAGERYPGLFRHAVTETVETDRFALTPSPLPESASVQVERRFYSQRDRELRYSPECTYAAFLEVENTPVVLVPSLIVTADRAPDAFLETSIVRRSRPVRNLYQSPDFSYVVPAVVMDNVRSNIGFTDWLQNSGVVLQPINEPLNTFAEKAVLLQESLIRAKT